MRLALVTLLIFLINACTTLKPYEYIYELRKIETSGEVMACYYNQVSDIQSGKMKCKSINELEQMNGKPWLLINAELWKKALTEGVDKLIQLQAENIPQNK